MNGWIKLHRKIIEWEWYNDPLVFRLFIHLLLQANQQAKKWQGIDIQSGELITSYPNLAVQLTGKQQAKIGVQQIRTALSKLKSTGEITVKTTNKYSIITIQNYQIYQFTNSQDNSPLTVKQQATNRQLTSNNNSKNENNYKEESVCRFAPPTYDEVKTYCNERANNVNPQKFVDFYESKGWLVGKTKMKSWQACVRTWEKTTPKNEQEQDIKKEKERKEYEEKFYLERGYYPPK